MANFLPKASSLWIRYRAKTNCRFSHDETHIGAGLMQQRREVNGRSACTNNRDIAIFEAAHIMMCAAVANDIAREARKSLWYVIEVADSCCYYDLTGFNRLTVIKYKLEAAI